MGKAFFAAVVRHVVLGVAMAAGQAVVETGASLTIEAMQKKMAEWGVNLDPNTVLGRFLDNFKGQIGMQASMAIMSASDKIYEGYMSEIKKAHDDKLVKVSRVCTEKLSSLKSKAKKKFFRTPVAYEEFIVNRAKGLANTVVENSKTTHISDFKDMKVVSGSMFNGLAVGTGTINTSANLYANSNFDDMKLFDSVQMLMNMKKVG